jgi:hypothetical protein
MSTKLYGIVPWKLFKEFDFMQKSGCEGNQKGIIWINSKHRYFHCLVDLYKVSSNYSPGVKNGPAPWGIDFYYVYLKTFKKNLSESARLRTLILIWYMISSIAPLPKFDSRVKIGPAPESKVFLICTYILKP